MLLFAVLLPAFFTAKAQRPVANFTADTTFGCAPLIVQFRDVSANNPSQWLWDLGNGTVSTLRNPQTLYFDPGTYTVKLLVRNASGADSVFKTNFITVNALPAVNFSASDTTGCFPLKVQFTDRSLPGSGINTAWRWDFGDGFQSTQQNPSHTYNIAGSFSITLTVRNSNGCISTGSKQFYININSGVKANFSFNTPFFSCRPPTTIQFVDSSTGVNINNYLWDFGDGNTSNISNPSHIYTTPGNYTVKLTVANSEGCVDSMVKNSSIIIGAVKANFTSPDTVCPSALINFNNTSSPTPSSVLWNFGDGTTSDTLNPVKLYTTPGSYTVKLVSDFGACQDSIVKSVYVRPKPSADFTTTGSFVTCVPPAIINFSSSTPGITSWQWNFGDGSTSTLPNPAHTYNRSGYFNVTLVVTDNKGCRDTAVKDSVVYIGPPQIVKLNGVPFQGCVPHVINLSADIVSPELIAGYLWDLGDGTTSTQPTLSHTYNIEGAYTIRLIVTTITGCKDTLTLPNAVEVNTRPVANFSATPRNVCAYQLIQFTDLSSQNVTEWLWIFGDGLTSSEKNPKHAYADTGLFTVKLVVTNRYCQDSIIFQDYIHILPPIASFKSAYNCNTPFFRSFTDASIEATSWKWDFGDGSPPVFSQNTTHSYASPGQYIVKLEVSNGSCTHSSTDTINIIDEHPDFTISNTALCKYSITKFTVTNVNPDNIYLYNWLFGDGSSLTTTEQIVSHTYTEAGTYSPTLIVVDNLGCIDTLRNLHSVEVFGPKAYFSNLPGTCVNGTITFRDSSIAVAGYPINEWVWDFGDGKTQAYTTPPFQHTYDTAGNFDVKLRLTDTRGCYDTLVKPLAVLITNPKALFIIPDSVKCSGNGVHFVNQSQGVNLSYNWEFGDGDVSSEKDPVHVYSTEGTYPTRLTVTDLFGCTDLSVITHKVLVVNAKASFVISDTFGTCPPLIVKLRSTSINYASLSWDFGDQGFSNIDTPTHTYNYPGTYIVKLRAQGYGSCADSAFTTVTIKGPTGQFTYNPLNLCTPGTVNFNSSTQNTASFLWDFSDGSTLNTTNLTVSHTYTTPGIYRPRMILSDLEGCRVPINGLADITVADVDARISLTNNTFCDSAYVQFRDSSVVLNDVIKSYSWDFGDFATSSAANPVHSYSFPGTYTVKLTVSTGFGCKDSVTLSTPVKIVQSPLINISGDSAVCAGGSILFTGIMQRPDTSVVRWRWTFGNGNTSNVINPPSQTYTTPGNYNVTAIATNSSGCADTALKRINVHPLPLLNAGDDTVICRGQNIVLQPSGATVYTWNANPFLNCTSCQNPIASPVLPLNTFYVTGATAFGCTRIDSVLVKVVQPFTITVSDADTLCKGESANLQATGTDFFTWTPVTGLSDPNSANPVARPLTTTTYTVIGTDYKRCFADTGYIPIVVYPIPEFNIIQDNIILPVGNSVTLNTENSPDIIRWRWVPATGLSCTNCAEPIASPRSTTTYRAQAFNQGGCRAEDKVTIQVVCNTGNYFIPNTFSPNGDGVNDIFYPRGKGIAGIRSLKIFNRWGEIVYQKSNFAANDASAGWDGTFNRVKLSPDVFVYTIEIICENSEIFPISGNVTLIK